MGLGRDQGTRGALGAVGLGHEVQRDMGTNPSLLVLPPLPWDLVLSPGACREPRDTAGLISTGDLPLPVPSQR